MELPLDCTVSYDDGFLSSDEADALFEELVGRYEIDRARLVVEAAGELVETDSFKILFSTPELIARNAHPERIHGKVHPWAGAMAELKDKVEGLAGQRFDIGMCLYYPDGDFHAAYHFDQETSGHATVLPSISLGAVRRFCFREQGSDEEAYALDLAHGSLLLMGDYCQSRYEHCLPKDPGCGRPRINITFREAKFQ